MPISTFKATGYTKHRDAKAEPQPMTIETQKHLDPSKGADKKVGLTVRIGVEPKEGDVPWTTWLNIRLRSPSAKPRSLLPPF